MIANKILINRAPLLTLWASVVTEGKETRTTS
jgi:hypothetical protein